MAATMFAPGFDGSVLPTYTRNPNQQRFRRWSNKVGLDETTQLLNVLIGAVAGTTATKTRTRIKHNSGSANDQGGKVQTEAVNNVNRASTSADVTALKALFTGFRAAPAAYPRDLSGNGGGAFTPG